MSRIDARLLRRLAAVVGTLGLAVALHAPLAASASPADGAAAFDGAGWWWRVQTGVVEVPAPPSVPEGGMMVSRAPDGAAAVAAVRFRIPAGADRLVLVLDVEDMTGVGVGLMACPASDRWFPAEAGGWDQRPGADCDRGAVEGQPSEDESTWIFAGVGALARGTVLDLVLQPANPDGVDAAAFAVVFGPPDDRSLMVEGGARPEGGLDPPPEEGQAPPATTDTDPAAGSPPPLADRPAAAPAPGAGAAPPVEIGPAAPRPPAPEVAAPGPRSGRPEANPSAPQPSSASVEAPDPPLPARLVGLLAAALTAAAAVGIWRRPAPPPRRLGTVGGLAGRGRDQRSDLT